MWLTRRLISGQCFPGGSYKLHIHVLHSIAQTISIGPFFLFSHIRLGGAQSGPPLAFFCLFIQRTMINSTHSISRDATLSSGRQINLISNLEREPARCGSRPSFSTSHTGGSNYIIEKNFRVSFALSITHARKEQRTRPLFVQVYVRSVIVAVWRCKKKHSLDRGREKCVFSHVLRLIAANKTGAQKNNF